MMTAIARCKPLGRGLKFKFQRVLVVQLTITWKLHMVCTHLEQQLTKLGTGMAGVCEQAGEAVDCKFKPTKARYKRNKYHSSHGKAQKLAVLHWSSWNVNAINKYTMFIRQKYRKKRGLGQ